MGDLKNKMKNILKKSVKAVVKYSPIKLPGGEGLPGEIAGFAKDATGAIKSGIYANKIGNVVKNANKATLKKKEAEDYIKEHPHYDGGMDSRIDTDTGRIIASANYPGFTYMNSKLSKDYGPTKEAVIKKWTDSEAKKAEKMKKIVSKESSKK